MGIISSQQHLSVTNAPLDQMRRQTALGMAHFAGTGPELKTCRECSHWTGCGRGDGYYSKNGKHGGLLKPRSCDKYETLMQSVGEPVPPTTRACKYFDEVPAAPAIAQK